MTPALASALGPVLRQMDAERAHRLGVLAVRLGLAGTDAGADDPALGMDAMGLRFGNPVGLAAGFDKNAVAVRGLSRLGFGFVETGSVTLRPQVGNPVPRVFRLPQDRAVINRYGFNNLGLDAYVARLAALRRPHRVPVGANVGLNKDGADPMADHLALVAAVAPWSDYVVINISSPNTPGLRDLQGEERLAAILSAVAGVPDRPPLLVKLAPDLSDAGLEAVVDTVARHGAAGLILGNTTIGRPAGLRGVHAMQGGGLSGPQLLGRSTAMLRRAHSVAAGRLVLVGCGGVWSGEDALRQIRAGASLVQLYTAFAYAGPVLVGRVKRELAAVLRRDGFRDVREAVGTAR